MAKLRLRKDKDESEKGTGRKGLQWNEIAQTLVDPKSYLTAVSSLTTLYLDCADGICRQCSSVPT